MNDHKYIEEKIEDFFPSSSSDEANNAIKELLEKNGSLQEEVRKLKREQEIQSIKLCEILEQRNKAKEDLDLPRKETMKIKINPFSIKTLLIKSLKQMNKLGFSKKKMK